MSVLIMRQRKTKYELEMLSDWEQTTHFQQFNVQKIPVL